MTGEQARAWLKRVVNGELIQIVPNTRTACRVLLEENQRLRRAIKLVIGHHSNLAWDEVPDAEKEK